ncbi:unnamed protein product [Blepharisma stoltei]|uniref:Short chain dehydrogenase n=1 Tax=Blepharisma stoltei TaxID=1481888 RepID=A0AAU9J3T9_9CILI|nr:unnamed protein product [Blepharisma stoltei]
MGNNLTLLKLFAVSEVKENSRVVITGASSGIGKEIALQYAKRKYSLVLAGRQLDTLQAIQEQCLKLGSPKVLAKETDVTIESQCKDLINFSVENLDGIDILVLCAGISAYQLFENVSDLSVYEKIMQTNYYGYLYCAFHGLPHLKKSRGQILVISSISGEIGLPFRTAYCASKFAVTGFFEALRSELNQDELAITIVCPPSVRTNLRNNSLVKVDGDKDNENRISVENCVANILAAADRRARKIYFPFKVYFAAYLRPFLPDFVDKKLKKAARL